MTALKIPYDQLSSDALQRLIEDFVTRDSTDYGETEVPLENKINQVLRQLETGKAVIIFDPKSQSCNIMRSDDQLVKKLDDQGG
jgi:uncharacterized protein